MFKGTSKSAYYVQGLSSEYFSNCIDDEAWNHLTENGKKTMEKNVFCQNTSRIPNST